MRALQTGLMAALVVGGVVATISTTFSTGCSNVSQVRQIFTALDGTGDRPRDVFFTDTKQIFCDVVFSAYNTDETVDVQFEQVTGEATLYDGSNSLGPVSRLWAAAEGVPTKGVSTLGFTLDSPEGADGGGKLPFPVGHWKCVVTVNGEHAGDHDFDVKYPTPDCPSSGGAYSGLSCAGYQGGAQCPSDSNFQNTTACVCQSASDVTGDPASRVFQCQ